MSALTSDVFLVGGEDEKSCISLSAGNWNIVVLTGLLMALRML